MITGISNIIIGIAIGYPLGKVIDWSIGVIAAPLYWRVQHWNEQRNRKFWETIQGSGPSHE